MTTQNQLTQQAAEELHSNMREHIQQYCLLDGKDFTLSSGSGSAYYFDCKKATLDGAFLNMFAKYVCDYIVPQLPQQPNVVGGLTLGADFITAAIAMYSTANKGTITQGSIVRSAVKKHGTASRIENKINDGDKNILIVEDVITSGASIANACDAFIEAGYKPLAMLTLVDREAGGIDMLKKKYSIEVFSILTSSDFVISDS